MKSSPDYWEFKGTIEDGKFSQMNSTIDLGHSMVTEF
jgi:hypothetical protein